jgi:3-methylfumaryl-CoA hydratase
MTSATWEPVVEEVSDSVPAVRAAALHDLLDAPGGPPAPGSPVPALWHWLAFLPRAPQRELGTDGHPKLGGFLPPVGLPRRMIAGGRVTFHSTAPLDAPLWRRSVVTSVTQKSGRSGELVFVEVLHELTSEGRPILSERQDLVYRDAPQVDRSSPPQAGTVSSSRRTAEPLSEDWTWRMELPTDPRVLFRFSALTYNAHRIHYDYPYVTQVEGYPNLVVHGPLQAVALAELCRRFAPDRTVITFTFRGLRPAFSGGPLHVAGRPVDTSKADLAVLDGTGQPTMTAAVEFGALAGA